jgi:hypothetical protein
MGRRSKLETDLRLMMFLKAVGDHPWADVRLIQSCTGLSEWEMKAASSLALERRLVERVERPSTGRPPRRFGLTPTGAVVGQTLTRGFLSDTLLGALRLDLARSLLTRWIGELVVVWSLSPYALPARKLIPMTDKTDDDVAALRKAQPYRSLRLDGLACLKFGEREYLNAALVVDPGDIKLDWFDQQFRSAYAWSRRADFYGRVRTFPAWIVVAANEMRLVQLTRCGRPGRRKVNRQRLSGSRPQGAQHATREQPWWNEHGRRTAVWAGSSPSGYPASTARRPVWWWGQLVADDGAAIHRLNQSLKHKARGLSDGPESRNSPGPDPRPSGRECATAEIAGAGGPVSPDHGERIGDGDGAGYQPCRSAYATWRNGD